MNFAETIKEVRRQLMMSQQKLADALSVSFSTLNRWENGHAIPSNLARKSFVDFCENNFINVSHLKTTNKE